MTGDTECKPEGDMLGGVYGIDYVVIKAAVLLWLKAVEEELLLVSDRTGFCRLPRLLSYTKRTRER